MHRLLAIVLLFLLTLPSVWAQSHQTVTLVQGDSMTLNANSEGALSFLWFRNDEIIPNQNNRSLIVREAGIYTVIGVGNICDSDLSDPVEVILTDSPGPKLVDMRIRNLPDRSAVLIGQSISYQIIVTNKSNERATQVTATIQLPKEVTFEQVGDINHGETSYDQSKHQITWILGIMEAGQNETISITVTSNQAGQANQLALVTSLETEMTPVDNKSEALVNIIALHIPNVFTPNGDNINDTFEIKGIQYLSSNRVTIFNHDGLEVFKAVNYKNDWDGKGLNNGTYYYIIEILMPNGQWELFKGYLTLLR